MIPLRDIAHARSGDKGSIANVAVFGRTPAAYAWLRRHLTAEAVEAYFKPLGVGRVVRYDVPNLDALNFVLPGVLGGGGSRSLRIDAQGKTLGQALLEMEVDAPESIVRRGRIAFEVGRTVPGAPSADLKSEIPNLKSEMGAWRPPYPLKT